MKYDLNQLQLSLTFSYFQSSYHGRNKDHPGQTEVQDLRMTDLA